MHSARGLVGLRTQELLVLRCCEAKPFSVALWVHTDHVYFMLYLKL